MSSIVFDIYRVEIDGEEMEGVTFAKHYREVPEVWGYKIRRLLCYGYGDRVLCEGDIDREQLFWREYECAKQGIKKIFKVFLLEEKAVTTTF